ncbi:MAG: hypothetical protein JW750_06875 [Anaerolineaceae bacterium]|nr:hypothetical protein [Anaerolineaceae bacterium]
MKTVHNFKLIQRRNKIGQYATIGSLGILALGLYLSFRDDMMTYALGALILGFILSQLGIYMGSRWGRSPRPDESITNALKGLDNKYSLYHYMTGAAHLLVGPAGVWMILPYTQGGTISYDEKKNRWKQKGGNAYLKIFAQESLGRPDLDVQSFGSDAQKYLAKVAPDVAEKLPVKALLLFINDKVEVTNADYPVPTLKADKLKDFIRQTAKKNNIDMELVEQLKEKLPQDDLTASKKKSK